MPTKATLHIAGCPRKGPPPFATEDVLVPGLLCLGRFRASFFKGPCSQDYGILGGQRARDLWDCLSWGIMEGPECLDIPVNRYTQYGSLV